MGAANPQSKGQGPGQLPDPSDLHLKNEWPCPSLQQQAPTTLAAYGASVSFSRGNQLEPRAVPGVWDGGSLRLSQITSVQHVSCGAVSGHGQHHLPISSPMVSSSHPHRAAPPGLHTAFCGKWHLPSQSLSPQRPLQPILETAFPQTNAGLQPKQLGSSSSSSGLPVCTAHPLLGVGDAE